MQPSMSAEVWESTDRPYLMWHYLDLRLAVARTKVGRRKLRLLACACCRPEGHVRGCWLVDLALGLGLQ